MADLNHTSKKQLMAELKTAREELDTSDSYRKTQGAVLIKLKKERDDWKQAAEEMKTSRDELSAQIEILTADVEALREVIRRGEKRLSEVRDQWFRASEDVRHAWEQRDQARAALQALALSNGRLTEHMDAKKLVMSTTDSCTPR